MSYLNANALELSWAMFAKFFQKQFVYFPQEKVHKTSNTFIYMQAAESKEIKANPCPDFTNVFKPELPHKGTQMQPFSFEQRDKETKLKKEEKITAILEEEKKVN